MIYNPTPVSVNVRGMRAVIAGRVLIRTSPTTTVPAKRHVRLYNAASGVLLAATWSDPATGAYRFEGLDARVEYLVMARDYLRRHNAVVADGLDAV